MKHLSRLMSRVRASTTTSSTLLSSVSAQIARPSSYMSCNRRYDSARVAWGKSSESGSRKISYLSLVIFLNHKDTKNTKISFIILCAFVVFISPVVHDGSSPIVHEACQCLYSSPNLRL